MGEPGAIAASSIGRHTCLHQPAADRVGGDSTVAPNGGWGPAFSRFLTQNVTCTNLARAGRSSKSYLAEGVWEVALDAKANTIWIFCNEAGDFTMANARTGQPLEIEDY